MKNNLLAIDLNYILTHTSDVWEELRDSQILITGGTGFFGNWLLDSFAWANQRLNLQATAIVLTRNFEAFRKKRPDLCQNPSIQFHEGDVRNFSTPQGKFSHVIHAATDASAKLNEENSWVMLDTIIQGTKHTLEIAHACGAKKFLLVSSGAVYGKQPSNLSHLPEDYLGAPAIEDLNAAYGIAKRTAEHMCLQFHKQYGLNTKIARCFAFVGPYLPLDKHFAIGNFILDGLRGGPIVVKGDGSSYRSYMYTAELTAWLWNILCKGKSGRPYNVGSDKAISITDLAKLVAMSFAPEKDILITHKNMPNQLSSRYIPTIERVKNELQLPHQIDLNEAIRRTKTWYQHDQS